MLRLCVAGAAGRMGNAVIHEASAKGHQITGAVEAPGNPCIGRSLRELGICDSETRIVGSDRISEAVQGRVPAVFSPNFSVGVNILFKLAQSLKAFPQEYNFSISEIHHTGKKDAPSGTAKKLGQIITDTRGYTRTVYGREGISPRQPEELEVTALRAGGVPGIHDLIVAGPYEMLRIEHTAFSRSVFAQGAVYAAEWISRQTQPTIFSMENVVGLS